MSDYSAVAPPQNFSQSSAFAAALQRARQIAAKINPGGSTGTSANSEASGGQKRPLEEGTEPDSKKVASGGGGGPSGGGGGGVAVVGAVGGGVAGNASGGGPGSGQPGAGGGPSPGGGGGGGTGTGSAAAAAAAQAAAVAARVAAAAAAGIQGLSVPGLALGPVSNEDIKVPDKMVGLIIGRGGEQISRLQSESGCKIQMAPDSGGAPERVCTLTGNTQAISRAKELIGAIVAQRSRTEGTGGARLDEMGLGGGGGSNGGGPGGGPGAGGNASHTGPNELQQVQTNPGLPTSGYQPPISNNEMQHFQPQQQTEQYAQSGARFTKVEIMVPGPKVGLIIGKGGETIKQLQEKSGAKMVVIQDGPSQENEKPLRITGDPQKVEHAKALVYELIAEKEIQNAFGGRSAVSNGGAGNLGPGRAGGASFPGNDFNGGLGGSGGGIGGDSVEVAVPRAAVGVVIGKGGDMIKKIQGETGARVQFQQGCDEGPGDRRCLLTGKPDQVEDARQRIEELIDSVLRRDNESGRGGRGGRPGGPGGFDRMGGGGREFGGDRGGRNWDGSGGQRGDRGEGKQEATFTVPAAKCGVIIGRGGETIKQINQQTGAHCELDRRPQPNPNEKTFVIRGQPDQIEQAKRLIAEKLQMGGGGGGGPGGGANGGGPPGQGQFPGMGAAGGPGGPQQHFAPQNWSGPAGFQQPWGANPQQPHPSDPNMFAAQNNQVQVNPQTGQPDYSAQWIEYYRSVGMHREAELIEQQAKANKGMAASGQGAPQVQPAQSAQPGGVPAGAQPQPGGVPGAAQNGQPDYSAQWAEYYRSTGKIKEAEFIEAQMKNKQAAAAAAAGGGGPGGPAGPAAGAGPQPSAAPNPYAQTQYGAYQAAAAGFYGATPQPPTQPGQPQYPGAPAGYPNYPGAYGHPNQPQPGDNQ